MKPREWNWVPHLVICYVVLGLLWFAAGAGLWRFAGGDSEQAILGPDARADNATVSTPGLTQTLVYAFGLTMIVIPILAVMATIRVILNEQRWRRERDARAS